MLYSELPWRGNDIRGLPDVWGVWYGKEEAEVTQHSHYFTTVRKVLENDLRLTSREAQSVSLSAFPLCCLHRVNPHHCSAPQVTITSICICQSHYTCPALNIVSRISSPSNAFNLGTHLPPSVTSAHYSCILPHTCSLLYSDYKSTIFPIWNVLLKTLS